MSLALQAHAAADNDWNGKDNEEEVREDVANGHGYKLCVALSTLAAWVGCDLPVVGEGLAFGKIRDDDRYEGRDENEADDGEAYVVGSSPGHLETSEELEDGVLEDPKTNIEGDQYLAARCVLACHLRCSVEDSAEKYQSACNPPLAQFFLGEVYTVQLYIVGSVYQHGVDDTNAHIKRYQGQRSHLVLLEEPLRPHKPTAHS